MFQNPFSFEGRIRRLEYGLSYVIYFAALLLVFFVLRAFAVFDSYLGLSLMFLWYILCSWFFEAQRTKRCHDKGDSALSGFSPFYFFTLFFDEGEYGDNRYGPNPKRLGDSGAEVIGKANEL